MTRKEHLQKLPLQKRLQAMDNIRKNGSLATFEANINQPCSNVKFFLAGCFIFQNTRQGRYYWWNIQQKYFGA